MRLMNPLTPPWKCLGRRDAEGFLKDLRRDRILENRSENVESERARRPLLENISSYRLIGASLTSD